MELVVGIDSGGTNYRVMAADKTGTVLGLYVGPPASHHYLARQELTHRIEKAIDHCLAQFAGKRRDIRALVCGTTGIDSMHDQEIVESCYKTLEDIHCPLKVMNDAELAHYTVTGGKGILLISGTGSIACGRTKQGVWARAGGWPLSIYGDEGSGVWVSRMALRHLGRRLDGAVPESPLSIYVQEELHILTRDELIQLALTKAGTPETLPKLGKLVSQAAQEGDRYAQEILKRAAKELMGLVEDVVCTLDMERTEPEFPLGVWGSTLLKSQVLLEHVCSLFRARFPQAFICLPQKEAVEGAVQKALALLEEMGK